MSVSMAPMAPEMLAMATRGPARRDLNWHR